MNTENRKWYKSENKNLYTWSRPNSPHQIHRSKESFYQWYYGTAKYLVTKDGTPLEGFKYLRTAKSFAEHRDWEEKLV